MKNNVYVETELNEAFETVMIESAEIVVVFSKRVPLLFWYDTYKLLKNQKQKVDRTLINGKWYKHIESNCIDARLFKTNKKQLLLTQ